jgi:octopine/nopaline transport system ATP-binding protein
VKFSSLVNRVAGDGADAWRTHYAALAARDRGEDVIILSVGDPDLPTPQPVVEHAIARLRAGDTHYTPARGRFALREAIAAAHCQRSQQPVDADNVIVLCGAQNALFVASLCLAGPGDEVLALEPMYPSYPATIAASGARMVRVRQPAEQGFRPDLDLLTRAITPRSRAIFLASPNNPSGVILNAGELADIALLARRHGLWIVADEVYAGLAPMGRVPSLASNLPDQVITISSLSKSHAMPGWRSGWLVGPKQLIRHAEDLVMSMLFGLPGFIQDAAITALQVAPAAEQRMREYCTARSNLMSHNLAGIRGIRVLFPEAGMFMLLDVRDSGLSSDRFVSELYRTHRVSVMDGGAFGEETRGFVRLSFATDAASIAEACRRMRQFCEVDLKNGTIT